MNRIFITLAVALSTLTAAAQSMPTDTILMVKDAQSVNVIKSKGQTEVTVVSGDSRYQYVANTSGSADVDINDPFAEGIDVNLPFVNNARSERIRATGFRDIYIGAYIPQDGVPGLKNGYEAAIANLIGFEWRPSTFSFNGGFGFATRKINFDKDHCLVGYNGVLGVLPWDRAQGECKSSIDIFSLTFPVIFTQQIYQQFGISLGAIVNLNTYAVGRTSYKIGDNYTKQTFKGLHQRPLTVDLVASLGFTNTIGVYFKYSPMSSFRDGYGPDYKAISVGVSAAF